MSCQRDAPSARRTADSCRRATSRASTRFARLAQAISSTKTTITPSSARITQVSDAASAPCVVERTCACQPAFAARVLAPLRVDERLELGVRRGHGGRRRQPADDAQRCGGRAAPSRRAAAASRYRPARDCRFRSTAGSTPTIGQRLAVEQERPVRPRRDRPSNCSLPEAMAEDAGRAAGPARLRLAGTAGRARPQAPTPRTGSRSPAPTGCAWRRRDRSACRCRARRRRAT